MAWEPEPGEPERARAWTLENLQQQTQTIRDASHEIDRILFIVGTGLLVVSVTLIGQFQHVEAFNLLM
jgi:hypothetical protein